MVKGELGYKYPEEYTFENRGISGNSITDLYARIKSDVINLAPVYMSLLIGVNDSAHEFAHKNGVTTEKFEKIYSMLIEEILDALPNIKIMLLEPFVLYNKDTDGVYSDGCYENLRHDVETKAAVAKKISEKYSLPFIPLQEKFDSVYNPENPNYWLFDGVHPTAAGHALIAKEWLKKFEEIK
jgi:lysophospholipase L1-like esterase